MERKVETRLGGHKLRLTGDWQKSEEATLEYPGSDGGFDLETVELRVKVGAAKGWLDITELVEELDGLDALEEEAAESIDEEDADGGEEE